MERSAYVMGKTAPSHQIVYRNVTGGRRGGHRVIFETLKLIPHRKKGESGPLGKARET